MHLTPCPPNAPAQPRRANVPADSTTHSTPAGRCSGLFGGSYRMTLRVTLPCGYVRYVGPTRPLGWRAEHQTIAPPCEEAQVIRADVVGIRGTLDVMRHGSGSSGPTCGRPGRTSEARGV